MTKEELIKAINDLDPTFSRLKINLDKYTLEQLQFHYERKLNAPESVKKRWDRMKRDPYSCSKPKSTVYYPDTPVREVQPKKKDGIALTGFDALNKGKTNAKETMV